MKGRDSMKDYKEVLKEVLVSIFEEDEDISIRRVYPWNDFNEKNYIVDIEGGRATNYFVSKYLIELCSLHTIGLEEIKEYTDNTTEPYWVSERTFNVFNSKMTPEAKLFIKLNNYL